VLPDKIIHNSNLDIETTKELKNLI